MPRGASFRERLSVWEFREAEGRLSWKQCFQESQKSLISVTYGDADHPLQHQKRARRYPERSDGYRKLVSKYPAQQGILPRVRERSRIIFSDIFKKNCF